MSTYLIEIRFGGEVKRRLREIIQNIARQVGSHSLVRGHYVPHISLYGPFRTREERTVLARLRDVCANYDIVPYRLQGFEHFNRETVYADVHTSQPLRELRYQLSQELEPVTFDAEAWDHNRWFNFHTTVARRESQKFEEIWDHVQNHERIKHDGYVKRINLIKDHNIRKEYSVPQGRFLNSDAATSRPGWARDRTLIDRWQRPSDHDELVPSQPGRVTRWKTMFSDRWSAHDSGTRRNQRFEEREKRTFVIGDLHLNHQNIIEYCDRPFKTLFEMNQQLISNWHDTVGPDDTVVLRGDLDLYFGNITTHDWLHALNGEIVFIRGNHDGAESVEYTDSYVLETDRRQYYCTHYPDEVPSDWDGWVIHGHKHNNDLQNYPVINYTQQRVNASVELIDYRPLSVRKLERCIDASPSTSNAQRLDDCGPLAADREEPMM